MIYNTAGYVHSIYNGGMVDGPGIRCVVFLSGCPLRCKYCHNPDTWEKTNGNAMTVSDVVTEVKKYKSYYKFGGGVTISGGEPFVQAGFLTEILKACKAQGIHTAIDTSGYANPEDVKNALAHTDLLLLDIKSFNPETYKNVTGVDIDKTLETLRLAKAQNIPTWIRFVLVPGLTDNMQDLNNLANFLEDYSNVKKIDVLPFHKSGEFKWKTHDIPYELADTQPPTEHMLEEARKIIIAVSSQIGTACDSTNR